jgi:hypothetical protein
MKRVFTLLFVLSAFVSCDILQELPGATTTTTGAGGVTQAEAAQGIREALGQGIAKAVTQLNTTDGFFSTAYKILLPPEAQKIEKTLRSLGMNQLVDKAILQINRGAEDAAGFAKPIFVDAIKGMTLTDAINIIRGSDTSATNYFRVRTSQKLTAAFSPVIKSSLDKVSATRYYGDMINTYNSFPTTATKLNPDLQSYVTLRATNALFDLISKEEKNIRANPVARTTEILKKVFGNLGR